MNLFIRVSYIFTDFLPICSLKYRERGGLKTPTLIIDLSTSSFSSIGFTSYILKSFVRCTHVYYYVFLEN